jgi:hypothetical protein
MDIGYSEINWGRTPQGLNGRTNNLNVNNLFEQQLQSRRLGTRGNVRVTGLLNDKTYYLKGRNGSREYRFSEKQVGKLKLLQAKLKGYIHRDGGPLDTKRRLEFERKFQGTQIQELEPIDLTDLVDFDHERGVDDTHFALKLFLWDTSTMNLRNRIRLQYIIALRTRILNTQKSIFKKLYDWILTTLTPTRTSTNVTSFIYDLTSPELTECVGCGICLKNIGNDPINSLIIYSDECSHIFHRTCLHEYKTSDLIRGFCLTELKTDCLQRCSTNIRHALAETCDEFFVRDYTDICPMCSLQEDDSTDNE